MRARRPPSGHVERDAVNDVVVVAGRILNELGGLALTDLVAGARHHRLLAPRLRGEAVAEGSEGEAAEILAERCGRPGLAAVGRHLDGVDAVTGVPGDAADGDSRTHLHVGPI